MALPPYRPTAIPSSILFRHVLLPYPCLYVLLSQEVMSVSVCRHDGRVNLLRGHLKGHVVEGVIFRAGSFRHGHDLLLGDFLHAQLSQGHRKSHFDAEVNDLFQFLGGYVLQHQLGNGCGP